MSFAEWIARRMGVSSSAAAEAVAASVAARRAPASSRALEQLSALAQSARDRLQAQAARRPPAGAPPEELAQWQAQTDALRLQVERLDDNLQYWTSRSQEQREAEFGDPSAAIPDSIRSAVQSGVTPAPGGGLRAAVERIRTARAGRVPYRQLANDLRAAIESATPVTVEGAPDLLQSNQFAALNDPKVQELLKSPDAANALITLAGDLGITNVRDNDLAGAVIRSVAQSAQASARSAARPQPSGRTPRTGSANVEAEAGRGQASVRMPDGTLRTADDARSALGVTGAGLRPGVYSGPEPLEAMQASPGVVVSYVPAINRVSGRPKVDDAGNIIPSLTPGTLNAPELTDERALQIAQNGLNYSGIDVSEEPVGIFAARTYRNADGELVTEPDFDRPVSQLVKRRTGGDGNRSAEAVEFLLPLGDGTFQRLTPNGGGRPEVLDELDVQRLLYQGYEPQDETLDALRQRLPSPEIMGRLITEAAMSGGQIARSDAQQILAQYAQLMRVGGQDAADAALDIAGGPEVGQERLAALQRLASAPPTPAEQAAEASRPAIRVTRDIAQPSTALANASLSEFQRNATSPQGAAYDFQASVGGSPATLEVSTPAAAVPGATGESVVSGLLTSGRPPRSNTRAARANRSTGSVDVGGPPMAEVFDTSGNESVDLADFGITAAPIMNPAQAPEMFGDLSPDDELRYSLFTRQFPFVRPLEAYGLMQRFMANPESWAAGIHPAAAKLARMLQNTRIDAGAGDVGDLPRGFRRSFDSSDPSFGVQADTGAVPVMTEATISGGAQAAPGLYGIGAPPPPRPRLAQIIEQNRLRREAERARIGLVPDARDPASQVRVDDELSASRDQEMADEAATAEMIRDAADAPSQERDWQSAATMRELFRMAFPESKNYPLGLQAADSRPSQMRDVSASAVEKFREIEGDLAELMERDRLGVPETERAELRQAIREKRAEFNRQLKLITNDSSRAVDGSGANQDRLMQVLLAGGTDRAAPARVSADDADESYDGSGFDVEAAVEGGLENATSSRSRRKPQLQAMSADAALQELLRTDAGDARQVIEKLVDASSRAQLPMTPEQVIYSMLKGYKGGETAFSDAALMDVASRGWADIQRSSPRNTAASTAVVGAPSPAQQVRGAMSRLRDAFGGFLRPGPIPPGRAAPDATSPQDAAFSMLPDPDAIEGMPTEAARQQISQLAAAEQEIAKLEEAGIDTASLRERAQLARNAIAMRLGEELKPPRRQVPDFSQPPPKRVPGEGVTEADMRDAQRVQDEGLTEDEAAAAASARQSLENERASRQAAQQPSFSQTADGRRFLEDTLRTGGYSNAAGRAYAVDAETASRLRELAADSMGDIVGSNRPAESLREDGDTSNPVVFGVNRKGNELHEIVAARESGSSPVIATMLGRPHDPNAPAPQGMEVVVFNKEGVPTFVAHGGNGVTVLDARGRDVTFDDDGAPAGAPAELLNARGVPVRPAAMTGNEGQSATSAANEPAVAGVARRAQSARSEGRQSIEEDGSADDVDAEDFDSLNRRADYADAQAAARNAASARADAAARRQGAAAKKPEVNALAPSTEPEASAPKPKSKTGRRLLAGAVAVGAGAYGTKKAQEAGYLPSNRDIVMAAIGPQMLAIPGYIDQSAMPEDTKQVAEPVVDRIRRARNVPYLTTANFLPY